MSDKKTPVQERDEFKAQVEKLQPLAESAEAANLKAVAALSELATERTNLAQAKAELAKAQGELVAAQAEVKAEREKLEALQKDVEARVLAEASAKAATIVAEAGINPGKTAVNEKPQGTEPKAAAPKLEGRDRLAAAWQVEAEALNKKK